MNWLEEFELKRNANFSTVAIFETTDPKRIKQFIFHSFDMYENVYVFDVQLARLFKVSLTADDKLSYTEVPLQPASGFNFPKPPEQGILSLLNDVKTIVVCKYITKDTRLFDLAYSVAHTYTTYSKRSTLALFVSSLSIVPQDLQQLSIVISIPPPTPEERRQLIKAVAEQLDQLMRKKKGVRFKVDNIDVLVNISAGLSLHDIESALMESFLLTKSFDPRMLTEYKIKILKQEGLQYVTPTRGFESVGGYQYLKDYIRNRVINVLKKPKLANKLGISIPRGIILYGPAGTGKSWFAKALAKELELPFIMLDSADFLRGIVGETEMRIRRVTRLLESLAPCVVFIDEIDQIGLSRSKVMSTDSGVSRRMSNMLLEWLGDEKRKTFIVGATNFLEDLDPAFIRAGRIDEIIPVFYPDLNARKEILEVHTSVVRRVPLADDVNLFEIARKTAWWTGAELEKLVKEASMIAFEKEKEKVYMEDFDEALSYIKVNTSTRKEVFLKMINVLKSLEIVNHKLIAEAEKVSKSIGGEGYLERLEGVV